MSRSFFSDPDHYHFFGPSFDLVNDHLSEEQKVKLINIISETMEEDADCQEMTIALSSLYESIGDPLSAYSTLLDDYFFRESSLCMIRKAMINREIGDVDEKLLAQITKRQNDPQLMRRVYAFLGFALMDEHKRAKELWMSLLEETWVRPPSGIDEILDFSCRYSVFNNLAFREQIEGINYLLRAGITENLEVELVCFSDAIPAYLSNLLSLIMLFTSDREDTEITDPLSVVVATAFGSADIIDGFLAEIDGTIDTKLIDQISIRSEEAVELGEEANALIHLLHWAADPLTHEEGLYEEVDRLMHSTHVNVLMIADWILHRIPSERCADFPPEYQPGYFRKRAEMLDEEIFPKEPDYSDDLDDESVEIEDANERTPDEILALSPEEVFELDDIELFFSYLRDHISDGKYLNMSDNFIELGLDLDRMDEVLNQKTVFQEHNCTEALTLIEAYLSVLDRKYKQAEARIQQAEMDPDEAALFLAKIYLQTESPKKTIEICEKLLKKKKMLISIYSLLIPAYWAAGREKKALAAEAAYQKIRIGTDRF